MSRNEGLISIIVPVYNVKEYLDECVRSIMNQSYGNIEIILVDDGSNDGSEEMCDSYGQIDKRIKVIHKRNGGLSDARNVGMSQASGEYIGFVDSDDFIDTNMYEEMIGLSLQYDADLVCARYDYVGAGSTYNLPMANGDILCIDSKEFLYDLIGGNGAVISTYSVWDRLYKRSLIEKLQFPRGMCYEDIVFSTKAILNSRQLVYINKFLYHYRIRKGSISHGNSESYDKRLITDRLPLQKEQLEWLAANGYKQLVNIAKASYYQEYLKMLAINTYPEYEALIQETVKRMRLSLLEVLRLNMDISCKTKLLIKMTAPGLLLRKYRIKRCTCTIGGNDEEALM